MINIIIITPVDYAAKVNEYVRNQAAELLKKSTDLHNPYEK